MDLGFDLWQSKNVQMCYNEKITNFSIFANFLSKNYIYLFPIGLYTHRSILFGPYNINYINNLIRKNWQRTNIAKNILTVASFPQTFVSRGVIFTFFDLKKRLSTAASKQLGHKRLRKNRKLGKRHKIFEIFSNSTSTFVNFGIQINWDAW